MFIFFWLHCSFNTQGKGIYIIVCLINSLASSQILITKHTALSETLDLHNASLYTIMHASP